MSKKGENIRKRKDGRWEGRYKNGFKENGKSRYSSVYGKSYTEVKNKLIYVKSEIAVYQRNPFVEKKFGDILLLWLKSNQIKVKKSTEAKYMYMIERHIKPQLGSKRISSLSAPVINGFLFDKMNNGRIDGKGGLSASYVKTMAIIIASALKFAANEGYGQLPKGDIIKPPTTSRGIQILSLTAQQQFERAVINSIDETKAGIFIALYTGIRIGELCALAWEDIDLDSKIIHIRHTVSRIRANNGDSTHTELIIDDPKTKAAVRDIPISQILLPVLEKMKQQSTSKYVISNRPNFVSTRTFDYRYKKALLDLGIPQINFHALRHTFATRCIEVGMDIKSVSQILGHSNAAITLNTYVHPSIEIIRIQLQKLTLLHEQ